MGREDDAFGRRRLEGPGSGARLARLRRRFAAANRGLQRRRRGQGLRLAATLGVLFGMVALWALVGPKAPRVASELISGRPARIVDGGTFDFGELRVRLASVDAPEMSSPHGEPARRHLETLVRTGAPIRCEDTGARTYGRIVARCLTYDGREIEAEMVEHGWAVDMLLFSHGRHLLSQARAMWAGRGMYRRGG